MAVILFILTTVLLIILDQITKYMALCYLKSNGAIPIIKNVFELTYVKNTGAAFGIFKDKIWFFIIITIIILSAIIYYYFKLPKEKHYNYLKLSLILITAGAVGNFIDRVFRGFVIDFFYFKLINFPVFNVADCYVVVGTILLAILLIFVYKEDDILNKV